MAKDTDEVRQDRTADRDAIQARMDDYLRHGGLISQLDWAGNVVGLVTEAPSGIRPVPKALPFNGAIKGDHMHRPAPTAKPEQARVVQLVPVVKKAAPAPTWKTAVVIDIVPELRRIREDAQRALARLNAAAERRTA